METLSRIAQLSAEVNALARAYILEPQAALREKIISCHLLISEIAYKGDPELDAARESTGQEAFKPVLPNVQELEPVALERISDSFTDSEANPAPDFFALKLMRYYWNGSEWSETLKPAVTFKDRAVALLAIDENFPHNPGFEVVNVAEETDAMRKTAEAIASEKTSSQDSKEDTQAP